MDYFLQARSDVIVQHLIPLPPLLFEPLAPSPRPPGVDFDMTGAQGDKLGLLQEPHVIIIIIIWLGYCLKKSLVQKMSAS